MQLGFEAVGIATAEPVEPLAVRRYEQWLSEGRNGCMDWATRNREVRNDPRLLLDGARSIIMGALNYFPARFQLDDAAKIAYYAYGQDYHDVIKRRLWQLAEWLDEQYGCRSRALVDSAPLRERYWAVKAGLGVIGMNNQLIIPGKGSYFFLGALITTLDLEPDKPLDGDCGRCGKCLNACPTAALNGDGAVDARRCLSCLTIEYHGDMPLWVKDAIGDRVIGCDECQRCCPHNRNAHATTIEELQPSEQLLSLTHSEILAMSEQDFRSLFRHSAVRRARLEGLKRNAALATPKP